MREPLDEVQNKRNQQAEQDAGRQWEVEGEVIAFNEDVTGQLAKERNARREYQDQANQDGNYTAENQYFT